MAENSQESLFANFSSSSEIKRPKMDSTLPPCVMTSSSFSYGSGLELSSGPNYSEANKNVAASASVAGSFLTHDSRLAGGCSEPDSTLADRSIFDAFYGYQRSTGNMNGNPQLNLRASQQGLRDVQAKESDLCTDGFCAIDNHNMPPSRVIHCRAVADGCKETDLVQAMKPFGKIRALTLMPKLRQALVEFEALESSIACITWAQGHPIIVLGRQMYVNFSKSQEINRDFSNSGMAQPPTNVLLFTIINAIHPINVDIIKRICSSHAEVQRIVIFHKNGLQVLAEFASTEAAQSVQRALNGCDIYAGCCTLKIDFSKTGRLNVHANTSETYDIEIERRKKGALLDLMTSDMDTSSIFSSRPTPSILTASKSSLSTWQTLSDGLPSPTQGTQRTSLLGENNIITSSEYSKLSDSAISTLLNKAAGFPAVQTNPTWLPDRYDKEGPYLDILARVMAQQGNEGGLTNGTCDIGGSPGRSRSALLGSQPTDQISPFVGFGNLSLAGGEGCVGMVYGINIEKMNCDRLFNLFCLYGNVVKVKVLTNKPGAAMVQYTDKMSTDIAIRNLNNLTLFGSKFQLSFSKHPFIADASQVATLPDGTPSAVNYADCRNNRFKYIPGGVDIFSRIHPPSKVLHYFNAPPGADDEHVKEVTKVFRNVGSEMPIKQATFSKMTRPTTAASVLTPRYASGNMEGRVFPDNGKSSSGLLEFSSIPAAVESLILANHYTMHREGGGAFTLKLAFSPSNAINN